MFKVKFFTYPNDRLPPNSISDEAVLELDDSATSEDLIRHLRIPKTTSKIIFVNGVQLDKTQVLKHGDVVNIFPGIAV